MQLCADNALFTKTKGGSDFACGSYLPVPALEHRGRRPCLFLGQKSGGLPIVYKRFGFLSMVLLSCKVTLCGGRCPQPLSACPARYGARVIRANAETLAAAIAVRNTVFGLWLRSLVSASTHETMHVKLVSYK